MYRVLLGNTASTHRRCFWTASSLHAVSARRASICFLYPHSPPRVRSVAFLMQFGGQSAQEFLDSLLLNLVDGVLIDAGCPSVGLHLLPRLGQDVLAVHLVVQRMEPPRRIRLRGPIQGPVEVLAP